MTRHYIINDQATERKDVIKMSGDEVAPPQHLLPLPQQHQQADDDEDDEESDEEQEEPDKELPPNGPLIITKPQVVTSVEIAMFMSNC